MTPDEFMRRLAAARDALRELELDHVPEIRAARAKLKTITFGQCYRVRLEDQIKLYNGDDDEAQEENQADR